MVTESRTINSIDGKYRVLAQLGQGGTADVSLAVARGPKGFNKLVVLKSMRTQFRTEPDFAEMFMVEARLAAQLNHPNIVQTNEVFDFDGLPVIVMEYLEGQALSAVLAKARGSEVFALQMHLRVISECLSALEYAHNLRDFEGTELGVVHRDVSPHNIFLTYDGQVKLLDFGIAKLNTSQVETATGVIKGKLRYMPPEQITGEGIDRRADIFAIGVMMWEAATGLKMWAKASEANIMNAVLNGEIPTPSSTGVEVAPELERIIMRALAYDKEERYPTAAAMQNDLDEYLSNLGSNLRVRDIGKVVSQLFSESRDQTRQVVTDQLARVVALSESDVANFQPIELTSVGTATGLSQANTVTTTQGGGSLKGTLLVALIGALIGAIVLALTQLNAQKEEMEIVAAARQTKPAEPAQVHIRITGFPGNASLELDGEVLPSNPYARDFTPEPEKEHQLKVSAPGYEDTVRTLKFDQNADLVITLTKLPEPEPEADAAPEPKPAPRPVVRVYRPQPAPVAAPKNDCDPPYTIDARGVKKFKPGCL